MDHAMTADVSATDGARLARDEGLKIKFRGKEHKGRAGFTIFNITNHWNPRDVQNNIASGQFGTFFNSADRSIRLKFEFVKY
jgi:hypothetical protein